MKEVVKKIESGVNKMEKDIKQESATLEMLKNSFKNAEKKDKRKDIVLFVIIFSLLAINAYFAYMFTTTTIMDTTTQEGIYNYTDSDGNIISSDLSLEDMQKILEENK